MNSRSTTTEHTIDGRRILLSSDLKDIFNMQEWSFGSSACESEHKGWLYKSRQSSPELLNKAERLGGRNSCEGEQLQTGASGSCSGKGGFWPSCYRKSFPEILSGKSRVILRLNRQSSLKGAFTRSSIT